MLNISIKHLNASNGCDALIYHSELWHNRIMKEKETLFRVFVAVFTTLSAMVLFPLSFNFRAPDSIMIDS